MSARALFLALAAASISASPLFADTFTYTGNGNWSDPANWLNGLVPPNDPTTQVTFAPTGSGAVTSTLDASRSSWEINSLTLNRSSGVQDTITTVPGTSLHFEGTNPFISLSSFAAAPIIAGTITSDSQLTLKGSPGINVATISADITAPSVLITSGNFLLSGTETLTDGITLAPINTLTFLMGPSDTLGTIPITVNVPKPASAFIQLKTGPGSQTTFSTPLTVNGGSDPVFSDGILVFDSSSSVLSPYTVSFSSLTANAFAALQTRFEGSNITVAFQSVTLNGTTSFDGNFALSNVSGAGGITAGNSQLGTLTLGTANTFTGGTLVKNTVIANATGALSSGPVQIDIDGMLVLNATAAANSDITSTEGPDTALGSVVYNANGAAGGHHIFARTVSLGNNVTDLGGDSFSIPNPGSLSGNSAALALLTRNGNITLAAGTLIENTDGVLPTVNNLGTNSDLILALHTTSPFNVTIGAGTPWGGIAGGHNGPYVGTVTALSNISLAGGTLGDGAAGSFNITAASPVVVTVTAAALNSALGDYSGVSSFDVTGGAALDAANALGGGNGSSPVAMTVESGGELSVTNSQAINAPLTLRAGSTLSIFAAGLTGSGLISRDTGGITFNIENAAAFSGSQLTPSFVAAADTVTLDLNDLAILPSLNPGATYVLPLFVTTQSAGFQLNGGTLRIDSPGGLAAAATGDNTIHVGAQGATLQASGPNVSPLISSIMIADISIPIISAGPLTIGILNPANAPFGGASGTVALSAANAIPSVTVSYGGLAVASPAALGTGPVTLNHAFLELYPLSPAFPATTAVYTNAITVVGDSILSDNTQSINDAAFFQPTTSNLSIGDVRLAAALELNMRSANLTINSLTPTADSTLSSDNPAATTIGALNADSSPHTLTFRGNNTVAGFIVTGPTADTGTIVVNSAFLDLEGSVAASTHPIILTNGGSFSSTSPIDRPLILQDAILNVGAEPVTTSDLTLSSTTLVLFAPSTSGDSSDLPLTVHGNLTLDGVLDLIPQTDSINPGDYTLFTYTGTLTDDGLDLPTSSSLAFSLDTGTPGSVILHVAAVPEPASLAILGLGGALLLGRRRRERGYQRLQ